MNRVECIKKIKIYNGNFNHWFLYNRENKEINCWLTEKNSEKVYSNIIYANHDKVNIITEGLYKVYNFSKYILIKIYFDRNSLNIIRRINYIK